MISQMISYKIMAKNRNYNYSDVDMALASKTIAGSLKTNLSELSTVRTNWHTVICR